MHTSRTELSTSPIETDEAFRSCVARAPAGIADTALITTAPPARAPRAQRTEAIRGPTTERFGPAPDDWQARWRDIVCALFLIVLLLPVIVLLALAIIVCDPGPAFFAHVRVGRNGQPFKCYKLRTMYRDAEERLALLLASHAGMRREWETAYKLNHDPRVTWLGDFLRRTSLDELPQLFNVLAGTMTLVGPRPIIADELKRYGRHASCYLQVKPGLTGLWQVTGRSEVSYRRRVATDRLYAHRKSLMLDFRILIATVPAVLTGRGAC